MIKLAVFLSGGGSNALRLVEHFDNHPSIEVSLIISNRKDAKGLNIAEQYGISKAVVTNRQLQEESFVNSILEGEEIEYIVLAGFLAKIPKYLIESYPEKIFNIHPSLLPKYGGKGMYGMHVHRAVKQAGEKDSGATIHLVNEEFDKGRILHQEKVKLDSKDEPETIASKVLQAEHMTYAPTIEAYILNHTY